MKNQKRTLAILLAVLLALILLILFVIPNLGRPAQTETVDERIFLCSLERADITVIQYTTAQGSDTLTLADGVWVSADGQAADQNAVANQLSAISGLYSTQLAYEGEDHFAPCGLDAPSLVVYAANGDGSTVLITVGSYNNALDRWYCTVDGGTEIYLIGNNLPTRFGVN